MEKSVNIIKNLPLFHIRTESRGELFHCPVRDVFTAVGPVLVILEERETLCLFKQIKRGNPPGHETIELFAVTDSTSAYDPVFSVCGSCRKNMVPMTSAVTEWFSKIDMWPAIRPV